MFNPNRIKNVEQYIRNKWSECIRSNREDDGSLLGLPYPYTVPSAKGMFQELYYWDTYFTNLGLVKHDRPELAKSNTDNMLALVERYGFMPNGSRTVFLNRSQPPYLSMMVRDVFEVYQDVEWLKSAFETLQKEYAFWMERRMTQSGLNRYYTEADEQQKMMFYQEIAARLHHTDEVSDSDKAQQGAHWLAECESGWDFNPRFKGRCADFLPVDLNSNLYAYEMNFAYFSEIIGNGEAVHWHEVADQRKQLIHKYLWDESRGMFMDYDVVHEQFSDIRSLAAFHPLWMKAATIEQAKSVRAHLTCFEYDYGLASCEKGPRSADYQWDYPNGWAPLHYITIEGLRNYGYEEDADRLTDKYLQLVAENFEKTGDLWEKYNVTDGSTLVVNEYEMPAMMGWTAGVFTQLCSRKRS